ncbi:prephenate dehydratase [Spiromyces aspiralis]|uniref:Prephenate dehydratase n=1 Tax=Spiromyces aspiralis TaxID=68401 RepID=A0ACC1HY60_9FUNG|nr:prephenate dehydratase [Spiromyces aspiralis]
MDLEQIRASIANVDRQIVKLLNERARISLDVAAAKRQNSNKESAGGEAGDIYVPSQEKRVFSRVKGLNCGPMSDESIVAIYREIMSASISLQPEITISYLGPLGTFSHEAAQARFGESVSYVPCSTIDDVISSVEDEKSAYGVVPIENSTHGIVVQTLDVFIARYQQSKFRIRGEIYLPVNQCLLSRYQLSAIRKVYSHPQAFGQSKEWLKQNLPDISQVEVASTAKAAELASAETYSAAVASKSCSQLYGLDILAEAINSNKDNTTRFFILGKSCDKPTGDDKSFLMITVDHRQPGALIKALEAFALNNINMTSMNSRPSGQRMWQYMFFVEVEGHEEDANVKSALKMMAPYCLDLVVLGSYPRQLVA